MNNPSNPITVPPKLGWRRGVVIFVLFWLTFVGVHHREAGWNVNSRLALTRAIVEKGSFTVGEYVRDKDADLYTEDRAFKDGRYYSDKIIGTSLLGLPAFGAIRLFDRLSGRPTSIPVATYLTTIFSVSITAALAGVVMTSLMLAFGATFAEAFLCALAMSFGTMLWGYSTLFYAYLPAVCFALMSFNLLFRARLTGRLGLPAVFDAGLLMGASLLCEYTLGIVFIALSIYVVWRARPRWGVGLFWLGAGLPLLAFAAYTLICFGEVCVPYKYLEKPIFQLSMSQGFQGIKFFRPVILFYITVHPYRGVFWLSPFLLLSLVGLGRMAWVERRRLGAEAFVCGAVFFGYIWFNSSYYMWWGGWAMGPRHLIPGLPFLVPPLLWVLRWNRWWAGAAGLAVVASIVLVGVPALVDPQLQHGPYRLGTLLNPYIIHWRDLKSPVFMFAWPAFFSGRAAWNLGTPAWLKGPWVFLSLSALWVVGLAALIRWSAPGHNRKKA